MMKIERQVQRQIERQKLSAGPLRRGGERERGTIIVAMIIVLVLIGLIAAGVLATSMDESNISVNRVDSQQTMYANDAAGQMALREFTNNVDYDGDGVIGGINGGNTATGPQIEQPTSSVFRPRVAVTRTDGASTTLSVAAAGQANVKRSTMTVTRPSTGATIAGVYFEGWHLPSSISQLSDTTLWTTTPQWTTVLQHPNMIDSGDARWVGGNTDNFIYRITGQINITQAGLWRFATTSDDGSRMWVNGTEVVNNDGAHSMSTAQGTITLSVGWVNFEVRNFEQGGSEGLEVYWQAPGAGSLTLIPDSSYRCTPASPIPSFVANGSSTISGDSSSAFVFMDAFNAATGEYGGANIDTSSGRIMTNSSTNGAMALSNWAQVRGSALSPPGSTATSVITLSTGATVSGTRSAASSRVAIVQNQLQPAAPGSSGALSLSSGTTTLSSNRRYTSITLSNSARLSISGAVRIWVDGAVQIDNTAGIDLQSGASLTMYVGGALQVSTSANINFNTFASGGRVPSRCWIYMTSSSAVQILNNADVVATIRAPQSALTMSTSGQLYGSFHGQTITMLNSARLHGDTSQTGASGGGSANLSLTAWQQVP